MAILTHQTVVYSQMNRADSLEMEGINPYPHEFERSCSLLDVYLDYNYVGKEGEEADLKLSGRVMDVRAVGKLLYVMLQDIDTELQCFLGLNALSAEELQTFSRSVKRGDWIGFKVNRLYRTSSGDLTAQVSGWMMLAPCLVSLPEKMSSTRRQRQQRAVHLAGNLEARAGFIARSRTTHHIRHFLEENGFLEVKTPSFRINRGIEEVKQIQDDVDGRLAKSYPHISPKPYLKQLVVGGLDAVYEICDSYRNERIDWLHYPESQVMECCLAPADISDMMHLTEGLFKRLVTEQQRSLQLTWYPREYMERLSQLRDERDIDDRTEDSRPSADNTIILDFELPWQRHSVYSLVQGVTGVDFLSLHSVDEAVELANGVGIWIGDEHPYSSVGAIALRILDELVIPNIVQPTFMVDHPFYECPWAKRHRHDPRLAESFELIVNGMRFATGCTEQNDPREQADQFARHPETCMGGEEDIGQMKDGYLDALWYGLPPTASLRIDIDRLVMMLVGAVDLRDVISFPMDKAR